MRFAGSLEGLPLNGRPGRRTSPRRQRLLAIAILSTLVSPALAAAPSPPEIRAEAALIRHSYPVPGTADELLKADDAVFGAFVARVRADFDRDLKSVSSKDHATERNFLNVRLAFQVLSGTEDRDALETIARIRALEDKPDAKLMSGLQMEALLKARMATGKASGQDYENAYAGNLTASLAALPWLTVASRVKQEQSAAEILNTAFLLGVVEAQLDPALKQSHALSSGIAWQAVGARGDLKLIIPLGPVTAKVLASYIRSHGDDKPDIWQAREVTLTTAKGLAPVNVAIWDSGSDLKLFPDQTYTDPSPSPWFDPHGLAFDKKGDPAHGDLQPLDAARAQQYPQVRGDLQGLSDAEGGFSTPASEAFKTKLAAMTPDQVTKYLETLNFFSIYVHGTHVAGIAARGNPLIRLAVARLTFEWRNIPDPPTEAQAERDAENFQTFVGWFRDHNVRVVNMSWGETPAEIAQALEKNGVGKDVQERMALVKKLFAIDAGGLFRAISSAPEILFVCAAGNGNANSSNIGAIPAAFKLPNLLTVGAVDQAGDEASFTNYGETVLVDADGYQVESVLPGGESMRLSGTSMATPAVANLAAKLIATDPDLTPEQVIKLIVGGATVSADGRRRNIDPKRSMALLESLPRPTRREGE